MGKRYLDIKPGSLEDAISKVNEKLSPKQKKLDVNKNGKIDGSDLAKLRAGKKEDMSSDTVLPKNAVEKGLLYAYRDRRNKKREFRKLWIQRINAGVRLYGMSYSEFMGKIHKNNILLNRKVLADLALNHPEAFKAIIEKVRS